MPIFRLAGEFDLQMPWEGHRPPEAGEYLFGTLVEVVPASYASQTRLR
jgi:hypothetical protein